MFAVRLQQGLPSTSPWVARPRPSAQHPLLRPHCGQVLDQAWRRSDMRGFDPLFFESSQGFRGGWPVEGQARGGEQ